MPLKNCLYAFGLFIVPGIAWTNWSCQSFTCTLDEPALYNSTLQACACPWPQCITNETSNCTDGQILVSSTNNECVCVEACIGQTCQFGAQVIFDPITRTCLCPALPLSCNITCAEDELLRYDGTTNTCQCVPVALPTASLIPPLTAIQTNTPILNSMHDMLTSQSVTSKIDSGMAQIYSALPDFYSNRISFTVVLPDSPLEAFPMTASATIPTDQIQVDSLLVLSPAHTINSATYNHSPQTNGSTPNPSNTIAKPKRTTTEITQIIAVQYNTDKTLTFFCQLPNGTVAILIADAFVNNIDAMDPTAPPELTISVTQPFTTSNIRRFPAPSNGVIGKSKRDEEDGTLIDNWCIQDVNAYTAVVTEEAVCAATLCTGAGGNRPAMFNPLRRTCYCLTG